LVPRSPRQAQLLRCFGLEQRHMCGPTRRANAGEWKEFVLNEVWGGLAMAETI